MNIKRHLPALNVLALVVALLIVAGPPAYSAGKRLITGADVQDSSLTGVDIANGSLSATDIDATVVKAPLQSYLTVRTVTVDGGVTMNYSSACRDANDILLSGGVNDYTDSFKLLASHTNDLGSLPNWYYAFTNVKDEPHEIYTYISCLEVA